MEENPFEEEQVAKEWIHAVETGKNGSRQKEIYPRLWKWSHTLAPELIVEIGAGQGVCSSKVDILKGRYIGVEPSAFLVERAKELYPEPNKKFLVGSAYDLPVETASANAVFSVGVWFHLGDLEKAHAEIARILKPGGKLLIFTSNPDKHELWESYFNSPEKEGNRLCGSVRVPTGTISKSSFYLHSEEEVRDSLKKYGITIDSLEKMGVGHRLDGERIWMVVAGTKLS